MQPNRALVALVAVATSPVIAATRITARVNLTAETTAAPKQHLAISGLGSTEASAPPIQWKETVEHDKEAGNGYKPGSPLYQKQERLKAEKKANGNGDEMTFEETFEDAEKIASTLTLGQKISIFVFQLIIILCCAGLYDRCHGRYKECDDEPLTHDTSGFSFYWFSLTHCFGAIGCCACCCLPIRWADTLSKEPHPAFFGFWVGLLVMASLVCLSDFTYGVGGLIALVVAVVYRQKLRAEYGIDRGVKSIIQDVLIWCCCAPCAAAQEAKQVEFVKNERGEPPAALKQHHSLFHHNDPLPEGTCPRCKGSGKLGIFGAHTGAGLANHPCPDCGGTGRV